MIQGLKKTTRRTEESRVPLNMETGCRQALLMVRNQNTGCWDNGLTPRGNCKLDLYLCRVR